MRLLSAIHRWAGGLIGLLLALLGLTGAILVWEGSWVTLPGASDPVVEDPASIAAIVDSVAGSGELSYVTFASEEIGLHQLVYADGSGAYVRQSGEVVDRWAAQWERPELWLFDLHHHLFAGAAGETVTGIAGIAGLLFVLTGFILWWRGRRSFRPTLMPKQFAPGPIVKHHRDMGVVVAPLLLLSLTTGVLMLFDPLRNMVIGEEVRPRVEFRATAFERASAIHAALHGSTARFPDAKLRRVTLPAKPGDPIVVRMRQPQEWTPNGRTQLSFDARSGEPISAEDPLAGNRAAAIAEKLYPLHSAKVGGLAMKLVMTVSGLALGLLGALATYSFWWRRWVKARRLRPLTPRSGSAPSPRPAGTG